MEIRRRKRELGRPIDNPVRHALEKTGYECKLLSVTHPWQPYMTFHTTGRFSRSDRSYHKNCGPTAITNLLDAAAARCGREDLLRLSPEEIFRRVAAIGRHRAAYWSIRDPIPLGGTSYAMLGNYIHTCLYRFGLGDRVRLSGRLLSSARDMAREIRRAELVIAAAGQPKMVTADMLKDGQILIDVGVNVDEEGNLCGDADYEAAGQLDLSITPVPGGVGTVTSSVLMRHVIEAAESLR